MKAMNQVDHVTSVIAITVCEVIRKIIAKMVFRYHTDVNKRPKMSVWYQKSILIINFSVTLHNYITRRKIVEVILLNSVD